MKNTNKTEKRVFARKVAAKLTNEEMKKIAGGSFGGQYASNSCTPIEQRPAENLH